MKNRTQKFIIIMLVAVFAIMGNTFMLFKAFDQKVMAEFTPESISIENGKFNQTASSFPVAPNGFTTVGTDTVAVKGIISVSDADYQNYGSEYYLANRPQKFDSNFDNQMLMINSQNTLSKFGYKSSNLTLSANSFYEISVYVLTKSGSTASIVLSGDKFDDLTQAKKLNFTTNGGWTLYTFYVETSAIKSSTANLELWIGSSVAGSSGYVLFDNATIKNITQNTFKIAKNLGSSQSNFVSLKNTPTTNIDFESYTVDNSSILYGNVNTPTSEVQINNVNLGNDNANMYQNTKALKLTATTAGAIGYKFYEFDANRFSLYKISIMAKTNLLNGNANLILKSNNPYGDDNTTYTPETKTLSVNTNSLTNNTYDNWIEFSVYVNGDAFFDRTISVELWLGDEKTTAVGSVMYDNFTITKLNSNDYNTGKSNSNSTELKLNTFTETPSLSNDFFNNVTLENETVSFPLAPQTWTHYEKQTNAGNYGVITTNTSIEGDSAPNNILKLENTSANFQYVKSADASVSASTSESVSYSKFIAYVKTQNVSGVGASIIIKSGENIIAQFTNITSTNWQKYEFHIKNGISAQTLNIYLQIGSEISNITGIAYFDNVSYKTTNEATFNAAKSASSTFTKVLDFSKEDFEITSGVKTNYVYAPALWTGDTTQNGLIAGIIDTANFESGLGISNPDAVVPNTHKNVLMIKSNQDVYYKYSNNLTINLTKDNYYKISVWVKTANISATKTTDDDGNKLSIGASITLNNLNEKFVGINTYDAGSLQNEWVEYVFHIKATSDLTTNLVLSLGNTEATTKGEVYFDNISVEQSTSALYNVAEENETTKIIGSTEVEEDDHDHDHESTGTNFDWVVIPTLLTALALIFAVVSYSVRKSKLVKKLSKKGKKSVKGENYDREKTVVKQHEKRLSAEKINSKINELSGNFKKIENEINEVTLKFEAYLTESNNVESNQLITNEQIQKYIDDNPQIDFDYEFDSENQKLKTENELLFNRTFFEVSKQNLNDEKTSIETEIKKLQK